MSLVERILLVFEQPTTGNVVRQTFSSQLGLPLSLGFEAFGITLRPGLELPQPESCLVIVHLNAGGQGLADVEAEAALFKVIATRLDQWKARIDLPPRERLIAWVEDQQFEISDPQLARDNLPLGTARSVFDPALLPPARTGEGVRVIIVDAEFSIELDQEVVPQPVYTSFVSGVPRLSRAAVDRHGDRATRIVAGPVTAGGIAPGCTVWIHQVANEQIVQADPSGPAPLPGKSTLELSSLLKALEYTRAAIGAESPDARRFSVLLTPLQFQCDTEETRGRCRDTLNAYALKIAALNVLWISAAGNGGRPKSFFPAEVPGVNAVAAVWQGGDGRWLLGSNSCWYEKVMYASLPYLYNATGKTLRLLETSGASSVAVGLVALFAQTVPPADRTVEHITARLQDVALAVTVFAGTEEVGDAALLDSAIASFSVNNLEAMNSMDARIRQKQWRQLYKAIVNEDNFWQNDEDKDPDPMKASLAHELHREVRTYGRTWGGANFADVLKDPNMASKMFVDQAKINAVIARAVPNSAAAPMTITHEEAMALYKLLVDDAAFLAIAPYAPPTDDGTGPSAW